MDIDKVENQLFDILILDEQVDLVYILICDLIVFINYCLILVDKQGVIGKKVFYNFIFYVFILCFIVEISGYFDLDVELKIWILLVIELVEVFQFKNDCNIVSIQKVLVIVVLK